MAWKWEQNCLEDQRDLMGKGNMKKMKVERIGEYTNSIYWCVHVLM